MFLLGYVRVCLKICVAKNYLVEKKHWSASLEAVTENVGLEALRMDISSMLPVRATKRKGTNPKVSPKSPALQIPKKKDPT